MTRELPQNRQPQQDIQEIPGCGSTRWLHDHHLLEWDADQGPTDYNNGAQLCGTHHRYVHEGKWKIRGNPDQALVFIRPDGREFTGMPPAQPRGLQQSIFAMATTAAERATIEREAIQAEREAEWEEFYKEREAARQEWLKTQKYEYPEDVVWDGWGDPIQDATTASRGDSAA